MLYFPGFFANDWSACASESAMDERWPVPGRTDAETIFHDGNGKLDEERIAKALFENWIEPTDGVRGLDFIADANIFQECVDGDFAIIDLARRISFLLDNAERLRL